MLNNQTLVTLGQEVETDCVGSSYDGKQNRYLVTYLISEFCTKFSFSWYKIHFNFQTMKVK